MASLVERRVVVVATRVDQDITAVHTLARAT